MMNVLVQVLAYVGGLAVVIGIACGLVHLHDLFDRVEALEINDDVRRNDIIEVKSQIMRIKENYK